MLEDTGDPNLKVIVAWIGVIGSIIAATFALIGTFINQRAGKINQLALEKHQREMKSVEARFTEKLQELKSELDEQKAEKDARRDYVYDARKRLYKEYEPLFFQFTESAEIALGHIQSLAERGREGNLGEGRYLSRDSYYFKSTVYKLLVPVAIFKLINNRLTLVDLQVDFRIYSQYYLAKLLYLAYTQDFIFARLSPKIPYDPYHPGWPELRMANPQIYYRQGFPAGRLDNALDLLITTDTAGANRVLSFGRFEEILDKIAETEVNSPLGVVKDMFFSFHPQKRPVLWRILICHAHIYSCVLRIRYETKCDINHLRRISESLFSLEQERQKYDWRQNEAEEDNKKVLEVPFSVAKDYLSQKLSEPHMSSSIDDA